LRADRNHCCGGVLGDAVMSKPEKLMMKVGKGCIIPADEYTTNKLKARKYSIGDVVSVQISKPRNPKFHRLVHGLGTLVVENIEGFEGMGAHKALKRLQREGLIECEEFSFKVEGCGMVTQYVPRSLSFESMSEEVFADVYKQICGVIVRLYWPKETSERVAEMAGLMVSQ